MTAQVIQRDKLGVLTKIGQGGQGVVYRRTQRQDQVRGVDGLQGIQDPDAAPRSISPHWPPCPPWWRSR